jgi:hypothetical protein
MARRTNTKDTLSKAQTEFNQARARLLDAKARAKKEARTLNKKRDDRRKILAGACALKVVQSDPDFATLFFARLDAFLIRPSERDIFPELKRPER